MTDEKVIQDTGGNAGSPGMTALVLAGAVNDGPLQPVDDAKYEALISLAGRPMIEYVLDALRAAPSVGRIGIVGPPDELRNGVALQDEILIPPAGGLLDNVEQGARQLADGNPLLVVTSDIPLLEATIVEDFLRRCQARPGRDAYYPVVRREDSEKAFPGVGRTYFHLREGAFTGGNFVVLQPEALLKARDVFDQAVQLRKKPVQMARLLGFGFIIRFVLRRLSMQDLEQFVLEKLGIDGAVVPVPYGEVGFDVDKPDDYELAQRRLHQGQIAEGG